MNEDKTREPLDVVARNIEALVKKADEYVKKSDGHIISAAMLMREVRCRVKAGDAGNITWREWALKNIKLSPSRLRDLQSIAEADDPAKELARQRELTRKRVEKHREKKAAEAWKQDKDRRDLIAWTKKAPIHEVRRLLKGARGLSYDAPFASIETRPTAGRQHAA